MEFYRMEDDAQDGPYAYGVGLGPRFNNSKKHPLPQEDGIEIPGMNYLFGFESLDQLKGWFSPEMIDYLTGLVRGKEVWNSETACYVKDTRPYNFRVSVYSVPEEFVARGGRQAVADPSKMTHIRTIQLQEVYA